MREGAHVAATSLEPCYNFFFFFKRRTDARVPCYKIINELHGKFKLGAGTNQKFVNNRRRRRRTEFLVKLIFCEATAYKRWMVKFRGG